MPLDIIKTFREELSKKNAKHHIVKARWLKQWLAPTHCLLCKSQIKTDSITPICDQCQHSFLKETNSCLKCGINISNSIDTVCGGCISSPPIWHSFNASYSYTTSIKEIVYQAKFKNSHSYCKLIASLMAQEIPKQFDNADFLIPVPLHPSRLKERGYNQSLLICRELSSITKIATLDCLEKTKATLPQSSLKRIDRLKSSPSFSPNIQLTKQNTQNSICKNKHAIIIDDVSTTGSTATQMSKALNKLGFSKIDVWVFARTC